MPADAHSTQSPAPHRHRALAWIALLVLPLVALAAVIVPVWLIQPFASQTRGELRLSYFLRAAAPLATILVLAGATAATMYLWRSARWWQRSAMALCVVIAGIATWFAQQNHFEWMFAPLEVVEFAKVEAAMFIEDTDKVLAVEINGDAAAYPLRQLAYHHLVQDAVGGVPIAVTY